MKRSICFPLQAAFTLLGLLVLLLMAALYIVMSNWAAFTLFGALALAYIAMHWRYLCVVCMDAAGVEQRFFCVRLQHYTWQEIREAGVMYPNARKRRSLNKKPAQCSIYMAPHRMDAQKKLEACMNWPPKDMIAMSYNEKRMQTLATCWNGRLTLFNVTARELFGDGVPLQNLNIEELRY